MPLADTEWDLVRCLVRDQLFMTAEPHSRLLEFFPEAFVGGLRLTTVPNENARELVRAAKLAGLGGPEPLSIRLLDALASLEAVQVLPDIHKLVELRDRLRADKAVIDATDPYRVCVLGGGLAVFIDRQPLRDTLRSLVEDRERMVLRVTGEPDTGKSYTYALIQHLAGWFPFRPARVVLDRATTAEDVVRELALYVAEDDTGPQRLDDPRKWTRYAARWLVRKALDADPEWWLIFDECNQLDPASDVLDLIGQLALAILDYTPGWDANRPRPRLALLGYGDEFPDMPWELRGRVCLDEAKVIDGSEVRSFFKQYFAEIYHHPTGEPAPNEVHIMERVNITVEEVLGAAHANSVGGGSYMRELGKATEEAVRAAMA